MTFDDFVFLVSRMRDAQREFFETHRDAEVRPKLIREAKALEARVDAAVARILRPEKSAMTQVSFLDPPEEDLP